MEETKNKPSRKSFIYYFDWAEELLKYPEDLRLKIDNAIKKYVLYQEEPTENEVKYSIFGMIKKQIDRDLDKYINKCRRNSENIKKRWERRSQKPIQENTTVYDRIRPDTNYTDNNNDNNNDNDIIIVELDKSNSMSEIEISDSNSLKEKESVKESVSQKQEINYSNLQDFFNLQMEKENAAISRIQVFTDKRKRAVNARCREYGKEAIFTVIVNASKSDFLNGRNNRNWIASFDWLFLPNNFTKVLEGNYDNKNNNNGYNNQQSFGTGNRGYESPAYKGKIAPDYGLILD